MKNWRNLGRNFGMPITFAFSRLVFWPFYLFQLPNLFHTLTFLFCILYFKGILFVGKKRIVFFWPFYISYFQIYFILHTNKFANIFLFYFSLFISYFKGILFVGKKRIWRAKGNFWSQSYRIWKSIHIALFFGRCLAVRSALSNKWGKRKRNDYNRWAINPC